MSRQTTAVTAPSRKEVTHERILEVAARAIRRSGYAGAGVASVMKEAGLTHGGFYAHFASRDALIAEAVRKAGRDSGEKLDQQVQARTKRGASPLRALLESYLSDAHRAAFESGCIVAALGSEMPRQADEVREASAERVQALMERVARALPAGESPAEAAVIASAMVGALQLSRALGDERRARSMLASVRKALLDRYDSA
jgi:AcrR family transcriptional regulator